jgi:hypothetical protein
MQLWVPLVASCLASRRLVWPVYLPYQPTVCNSLLLKGLVTEIHIAVIKDGWIWNGFLGMGIKTLIQERSYKRILDSSSYVFLFLK